MIGWHAMGMNLCKLGDGKGHGGLVCCSSWGHKKLNITSD